MSADLDASIAIWRLAVRRVVPTAVLRGLVSGGYVLSAAAQYASVAGTAVQRAQPVATMGTNVGLEAMLGQARRIDTLGGYLAWRSVLLVMAGLAVGLVVQWVIVAAGCVIAGRTSHTPLDTTASLFLASTVTAGAAMFLGVGLICGQLAVSRRQAYQLAGGVLGIVYVIRMVADSDAGLGWLRWASPLGWLEQLRPLTTPAPLALLPVAVFTAALCAATIWIAGRRDVGEGVLPARDARRARVRFLGGPLGLAFRLNWALTASWMFAIVASAFIGGLVSKSGSGSAGDSMRGAVGRLGVADARSTSGTTAYLTVFFIICSGMIACAIVSQLSSARAEEAEGRLDNLLARPVGRIRWLAGRIAIAVVATFATGAATGLAAWAGQRVQYGGVAPGALIVAGAYLAFPAIVVLSIGIVVYSVLPRTTTVVAYAVVVWSFVVQLFGVGTSVNHWLLDTSVFTHIAHVPAADPSWADAAWLSGLALAGFAAGLALFARRDLAPA